MLASALALPPQGQASSLHIHHGADLEIQAKQKTAVLASGPVPCLESYLGLDCLQLLQCPPGKAAAAAWAEQLVRTEGTVLLGFVCLFVCFFPYQVKSGHL